MGYIHGRHVSEYMEELAEDEPEKYKQIFGKYIEEGIEADDLEEMYEKVHEAIREDPSFTKKERKSTPARRRAGRRPSSRSRRGRPTSSSRWRFSSPPSRAHERINTSGSCKGGQNRCTTKK